MLLPQTIKLKFCLFNSSSFFAANRMQIYLTGKCSLSGANNSINLNPTFFTGGYLEIQEADSLDSGLCHYSVSGS